MNYHFNKYLIVTDDVNGNIIFYDTLTYKKYYIDSINRDLFYHIRDQIISTGDCVDNVSNINELLQANIICKDDSQQKELLRMKKEEILNSHKVFTLILLPTEQCNFKCGYCYERHISGKMSERTVEKICELVDFVLTEYDMIFVSWFGGEPLLAIDVIKSLMLKISDICKKHKKPYISSMTTNGYLLSPSNIRELLKLHVLQYQVTLDGGKKTHDKQRPLNNGDGTFEVILRNLLHIKREIKTSTFKVIVRVNVSNDLTKEEIEALQKEFEGDNRFLINLQRIFEAGEYKDTGIEKYMDIFAEGVDYISGSLTPGDTICYAAKNNTLMIRTDGSIGKCTVNLNDEANNFGNINNLDGGNISYNKFIYLHSIHRETDCEKCSVYPLCFGRQCPARQSQLCSFILEKYRLMVRSLLPEATKIYLSNESDGRN